MKQVKRIAIAIVCTVFFFVTADFIGGLVCDKLYYGAKYGMFARQNYALRQSQDDIIIVGSSRAAHHYIPSIFADSLGMSCYNAASDGQCIYYQYGVISAMLERGYKPKLVIYEVINLDLQVSKGATFSINAACETLAPEFGNYKAIDSLFALRDRKELYKLACSRFYKYNSQLVQLLNCNFLPNKDDRGYDPLYGELPSETILKEGVETVDIDERKSAYFEKFITLLQENNIRLIMVQSPWFSKVETSGIIEAKRIATVYGVSFIDMKNESDLMEGRFFRDVMHMNHEGAKLFSSKLSKEIKQILR